MKKLKIPSVVVFHLKDKVEDFLAKELFQISRNLGSRFVSDSKIKNLEFSNEYLNRQFDRLRYYAKTGQWEKFDYLASKLLKKSMVYRIYALNHVFPNYPSAHGTKFMHWLQEVERLASTESNDFVYTRQWIDKKAGDAARPLGVPEAAHRIYGHMMTRIMEAYLCGTDQYTSNQHGGTPGRGTMTYVRELAKRFLKHKRIYEFDLKGYFDHLSHNSIIELFQSKILIHYLTGALKAKPVAYALPDRRFDEQVPITVLTDEDARDEIFEELYVKYKAVLELRVPLQFIPEEAKLLMDKLYGITWRTGFDGMDAMFDTGEYDYDPSSGQTWKEWLRSVTDIMTDKLINDSNIEEYANRAKGHTYSDAEDTLHITQQQRNEGRDMWKDLHLPEQGVPQGSSFGPVLASILLGHVMPKDSLIYMDDGIVFMKDSDLRTTETMNERYNRRVSAIMCEVNPTKSRVLETSDLLTKGLKIIGTRWHKVRSIWSDSITVSSETRKGISRLLFTPTQLETEKIFAEFLNSGLISPSKRRLLRWYVDKGKLNRIVGSELFDIASRIKILGNILTRAYSPESDLESMKQEIEIGIFKAELKLKSARGSLGERIINHSKTILLETTEGPMKVKPSLYNVRAICNNVLLRYLKGEQPIRAFKVQGLRKPWNPKDRILKKASRKG